MLISGKRQFQGDLKGAEKYVKINVNGVEANFRMCLDNSGEAYFLKEVDYDKVIDSIEVVQDSIDKNNGYLGNVHRLDHSISDSGVLKLKEQCSAVVHAPQIQRYVLMFIHYLQMRRPVILPCLQAMRISVTIDKEAEEKRAFIEAKKGENFLKVEVIFAKYRATGTAPKKLFYI